MIVSIPMDSSLIEQLSDPSRAKRLAAAREVGGLIQSGELQTERKQEVNNHVHTRYSFSPYYPAMAAFKAWEAGLTTVGCIDHDSVSGGQEMIDASACFGIASTIGCEVRVNADGTAVEGRKLNNPNTVNNAYVVIHGLPPRQIDKAREYLRPIAKARGLRNRKMVEAFNQRLATLGIESLDYENDVEAVSEVRDGGSITERHLLYALVLKLLAHCGKGEPLVHFVASELSIEIPDEIRALLADAANPHYEYDLLGILKSTFLDDVFIQPDNEECISVYDFIPFVLSIGAIPAYAYLGDVRGSATGDKKDEKFEDDYLDELMPELKRIGFQAITYMPPRNSLGQLVRVQELCREYDFMEITGVDINSSRQSFNCPIITEPAFVHLIDSTWALIAHEKLANHDETLGLFHQANPLAAKPLGERIAVYSDIGRRMDCFHPDSIVAAAEELGL